MSNKYIEAVETALESSAELPHHLFEMPMILTETTESRVMKAIVEYVDEQKIKTTHVSQGEISGEHVSVGADDIVRAIGHLIMFYFTLGLVFERNEDFREKMSVTMDELVDRLAGTPTDFMLKEVDKLAAMIDKVSWDAFIGDEELKEAAGPLTKKLGNGMIQIIVSETDADRANSGDVKESLAESMNIYQTTAAALMSIFALGRHTEEVMSGRNVKEKSPTSDSLFFSSHYKEQRGR